MPSDKYLHLGKLGTAFFIIGAVFLLTLFWTKLPPELPLFYSRPWGEDQLGKPLDLWLLPLSTIFVFFCGLVSHKLLKEEKLILQIVVFGAFLFAFLSFFTLCKIIALIL